MEYTKKQITEAIAHWQKVLESMNEAEESLTKYLYITKVNDSFKIENLRKAGISGLKKPEDPFQNETLTKKLSRYSTCIPERLEKAYQISIPENYSGDLKSLEKEFFAAIVKGGGKQIGEKELFSISDPDLKVVIDKFLKSHKGFSSI